MVEVERRRARHQKGESVHCLAGPCKTKGSRQDFGVVGCRGSRVQALGAQNPQSCAKKWSSSLVQT